MTQHNRRCRYHWHLMSSNELMEILKYISKRSFKHDGFFSGWFFHKLYIAVTNAEAADIISRKCLQKDDFMNTGRSLLGNGSFVAPVAIWRPRRKLLSPIFSTKVLNSFLPIFSKQNAVLVKQLRNYAGKGNICIFKYLTAYAMDTVCETSLGVEINVQKNHNHPVLKAIKGFLNIAVYRALRPWFLYDITFKFSSNYRLFYDHINVLKNFVLEIIKCKREEIERKQQTKNINYIKPSTGKYLIGDEEDAKTQSVIELLLEQSDCIDDLIIQEEVLVLLIAGTDTSAVATSFAGLLLAKHPEIQDKLYEEINEILGTSIRPIEACDLHKLKYLDAVIKETLRLYPPVPAIARKVVEPVTLPTGFTLLPGVGIILNIWGLHRNPKYWGDDADMFRPERFFDSPPTHPAAFMPFSYSSRNCLGYQFAMNSLKITLANLVKSFWLLPPCDAVGNVPDDFLKKDAPFPVQYEFMLRHKDDFYIRLENRNLVDQNSN